mmetsp:Transcript_88909/g.238058  ORF Transcript_88909/g.238058 Transcript_88909/m.238058 type:complete len:210 (+) Transcript_88909:1655-2284(+)
MLPWTCNPCGACLWGAKIPAARSTGVREERACLSWVARRCESRGRRMYPGAQRWERGIVVRSLVCPDLKVQQRPSSAQQTTPTPSPSLMVSTPRVRLDSAQSPSPWAASPTRHVLAAQGTCARPLACPGICRSAGRRSPCTVPWRRGSSTSPGCSASSSCHADSKGMTLTIRTVLMCSLAKIAQSSVAQVPSAVLCTLAPWPTRCSTGP